MMLEPQSSMQNIALAQRITVNEFNMTKAQHTTVQHQTHAHACRCTHMLKVRMCTHKQVERWRRFDSCANRSNPHRDHHQSSFHMTCPHLGYCVLYWWCRRKKIEFLARCFTSTVREKIDHRLTSRSQTRCHRRALCNTAIQVVPFNAVAVIFDAVAAALLLLLLCALDVPTKLAYQ